MHPITLHSASADETETIEALVDTGATYTSIPAPILERLGIEPIGAIRLRLANGQTEHRPIGQARALIDGDVRTMVCVFSFPDAPAVIGAVTLEVFGLGVDPIAQRLVPVEAYWR